MHSMMAGPGRSQGRLARMQIHVALQTLLWSLLLFLLGPRAGITAAMFRGQDLAVLLLGAMVLLLLASRMRDAPAIRLPAPAMLAAALAVAVLALATAGTWLVFADFPLTRDEIMADFDAGFLAAGQLVAPVPAEWQGLAGALMPQFMLPVPAETGWLSSYLPGNAALRAIGARTIGMEWTNPLLAAVAVVAVYRIGRRLWPDDHGPALVAALLTASSAQLLVMAMTPYAMTAHLAFNLIWLWCFLRGDRRGDAGALAAGFIATGLHQLIFHPLFVAPFLLHLWLRRELGRALFYALGYGAIGLFWIFYWQIILPGAAGGPDPAAGSGLSYLAARLLALLAAVEPSGLVTMGFNLLRFAAWQNLLLLPLALLAWPALRRGDGIARPLAGGILLTLAVMLVLLPWQGLGWGYRYLHGMIGSFALLAGYGWHGLGGEGRRPHFALAAATLATLFLMLPMQLKHAHDYAAPRARAFAMAAAAPADVVLIVPAEDLFDDLVRNAPDLSNRPKIMDLRRLDAAQIHDLCRRYRVALFDIRNGARAGLPANPSQEVLDRYSEASNRLGCGTPLPPD